MPWRRCFSHSTGLAGAERRAKRARYEAFLCPLPSAGLAGMGNPLRVVEVLIVRSDRSSANEGVKRALEDAPGRRSPARPTVASARSPGPARDAYPALPRAPAIERLFTVEGDGPFPVDMLRQDQCWPARRRDTLAITMSGDHATPTPHRQVVLATSNHKAPSLKLWRSKGWRVIL